MCSVARQDGQDVFAVRALCLCVVFVLVVCIYLDQDVPCSFYVLAFISIRMCSDARQDGIGEVCPGLRAVTSECSDSSWGHGWSSLAFSETNNHDSVDVWK